MRTPGQKLWQVTHIYHKEWHSWEESWRWTYIRKSYGIPYHYWIQIYRNIHQIHPISLDKHVKFDSKKTHFKNFVKALLGALQAREKLPMTSWSNISKGTRPSKKFSLENIFSKDQWIWCRHQPIRRPSHYPCWE